MSGKRFLVTGCAGFIGGHMVERLLAEGYEVTGVDDFSTGTRENLEPTLGRIRFIEGSICDADVCAEAVSGAERIIHLASIPSVPRSVANPPESAQASVMGSVALLDAARKSGVKRFVQASSSSVYGDSDVIPRVETAQPDPMSPYAVAKLTQEHYARVFYKCYGLDTASLRYFNVFGPRQNPRSLYAAVIPRFIGRMLAGEAVEIYGDGEQTRDFTYIDNVVDANLKAALAERPLCGISINVAAGAATTLNELLAALNQLLGLDIKATYLAPRAGDVRHSLADIDEAAACIGYEPRVDLSEGLRRTVAFFRDRND